MFGKSPEVAKPKEAVKTPPPTPSEPIIEARKTIKVVEFCGAIASPDEKVLFARFDDGSIRWRTPDRGTWVKLCDDEIEV